MMAQAGGDRDAWLLLWLAPDIGRLRFHRLLHAFGSPQAVLGARESELRAVPGMDRAAARGVLQAADLIDLAAEKALMEKHGARLVTLADSEYPSNLRHAFTPPPVLYVRGELQPEDRYSIAIVGSRLSTVYGRTVAAQLAAELVAAGLAIVSGLALGIDAAAHRAALENGGRTLAVLANGLSRCYPSENQGLMNEIVEQGAALSEYPMTESPARMNFHERNHILAAIALGTAIVEAPARSGALITARHAQEENRGLYAVPADINRKSAQGSNELIRSGVARPILSGRDILEDLHGQLRGMLSQESGGAPETRLPDPPPLQLSEEERLVHAIVAEGPIAIDELSQRLADRSWGAGRLATLLLSLEMKRAIRQLPGKVFAPAK